MDRDCIHNPIFKIPCLTLYQTSLYMISINRLHVVQTNYIGKSKSTLNKHPATHIYALICFALFKMAANTEHHIQRLLSKLSI